MATTKRKRIKARPPAVRTKVWFEAGGQFVCGTGVARLLTGIEQSGTLAEAARSARMSYRYAWSLIDEAEQHLGARLIERHAGGLHGGQSALSESGRRMLRAFNHLNEDVARYARQRYVELCEQENADG